MVEPRRSRARRHPEAPAATLEDWLDVVERDDVRRALGLGFGAIGRARSGLARERVLAVGEVDPARERPRGLRARKRSEPDVDALSEHEHVEAALGCAQGVHPASGAVHDAVARADRIRSPVLPQQTAAAEHEEDLLIGAVLVRGRREIPGLDLDPAHADRASAGGAPEVAPQPFHVAERELANARLGEVRGRRIHARDAITARAT